MGEEKEEKKEEEKKEDKVRKNLFHKCGNFLYKDWISELLEIKFNFDGDWDDDFAGGKTLYKLARKLEELSGVPETHSYESDLTEDEFFLEFRRACSKLGIPIELIFDDDDWNDDADGEKIMVTLECLYQKYLQVTGKANPRKEKPAKPVRQDAPRAEEASPFEQHADNALHADGDKHQHSFLGSLAKAIGHTSKYSISEYDPATAHLLGDQDTRIREWPLFRISKENGTFKQFEEELEKLANASAEEWKQFQKMHNTDHVHSLIHHHQKKPQAHNLPDYVDDIIQRKKLLVEVVGVFGESCAHIACLFNNFTLMIQIVLKYPLLLNQPYLHKMYAGETLLHMLLAKGRDAEVQFLLRHNVHLEERCHGTFFNPHPGRVFLGEYPLSFAANHNKPELAQKMVKILVDANADLYSSDRFGNNILHNLVRNNNATMYEFFHDNWSTECKKLEKMLNHKGLTPLQYAASLGHMDMIVCILDTRRIFLWKYLNSANYAYPLEEIDSLHRIKNPVQAATTADVEMTEHRRRRHPRAAPKNHFSAIEMLVYSPNLSVEEKRIRAQILSIPFLKQLVYDKWNSYAAAQFYSWLGIYFVFLCCITYFTIWTTTPALTSSSFWGLLSFLFAFSVISLIMEIRDMSRLGKLYLFQDTFLFHFLAIMYSGFTIAYFALSFYGGGDASCNMQQIYQNSLLSNQTLATGYTSVSQLPVICGAANACISVAAFSSWVYLLYFTRGFPDLGLFVVSLREILGHDLFPFIIVFFVWLMAFCVAFFPLWNSDQNFFEIGAVMYTTLLISIYSINFPFADIANSQPQQLVTIFFILSIFILGVLLTNMLIAAMSTTYGLIQDQAMDQSYFEFVSTILLLERRLKFFHYFIDFKLKKTMSLPNQSGQYFQVEEEEEDLEEDDD